MTVLPLSIFVITLNEADRLPRTLASVKGLSDDIVVVDSGSTDGTPKLAASLSARVFFNEWPGYGKQKRFAEEQCRHHWLLNLDADEELTPALAEEIRALFAQGEPPLPGYTIPVRDLLPGEKRLSRFAHTNRVLRLYDRRRARFSESPVHDSVILPEGAATGALTAPALHYSFRSLAHAVEKMNHYTSAQSADLQRRGKKISLLRAVCEFKIAFCKAYFLRGYILRGFPGFAVAMQYGFARFLRLAKAKLGE